MCVVFVDFDVVVGVVLVECFVYVCYVLLFLLCDLIDIDVLCGVIDVICVCIGVIVVFVNNVVNDMCYVIGDVMFVLFDVGIVVNLCY